MGKSVSCNVSSPCMARFWIVAAEMAGSEDTVLSLKIIQYFDCPNVGKENSKNPK